MVGGRNNVELNKEYFVSDDAKYVITMKVDDKSKNGDMTQDKTHFVYYYDGDKITDLKTYFEYSDAEKAGRAYEFYNTNNRDKYKNIELRDKYVILTSFESEYEGLSSENIRQQAEFMRQFYPPEEDVDEVDSHNDGDENKVDENSGEENEKGVD